MGLWPIFYLWCKNVRQAPVKIRELIEPTATALGCELLGVEMLPRGHGVLLRIYLDKPEGITVEDCERISHQVSGVFEVHEPIRSGYTLEVTSPGEDRPLFNAAQFARFIGQRAKVRLSVPQAGRRNFVGIITAVRESCITLEVDSAPLDVNMGDIDIARLAPLPIEEPTKVKGKRPATQKKTAP